MISTYKNYGLLSLFRLARDIIITKIFFNSCRVVRWPFYIRGKGIDFGIGLTTGVGLRIDIINSNGKTKLKFGNRVQLNDYVHIGVAELIIIEDDVLIGSKVLITDHNHGSYSGNDQSHPSDIQIKRQIVSKPVIIKKNVWIGENVSILSGVVIGENSIIGSNSVVTKSIEPNSIAAGNPVKVIKKWSTSNCQWVNNE